MGTGNPTRQKMLWLTRQKKDLTDIMRILLAHQSALALGRLRKRLDHQPSIEVQHSVSDLSQTYDFAEHRQPDCVVISAALANCPEFEVLDAMFRMMGIGCVVLQSDGPRPEHCLSTKVARHVIFLQETAPDDALITALQQSRTTRTKVPASAAIGAVKQSFDNRRLILIGSSTGGVDALLNVIKHFPADCPPTLIVQHTGGRFVQSLIKLLDGGTAAHVQGARHGMAATAGNIYLAPDDTVHLKLAPGRTPTIALSGEDLVSGHRPSVDALFQSAVYHAHSVTAAILTGMGRDGAAGITALRQAGARTVGQDQATSVVYGMPRVAQELGGIDRQLPIHDIGPALLRASEARAPA